MGSEVETVDTGIGVMITPVVSDTKTLTVDEAFARIHARSPYRGPCVTQEEMDKAVADAAVERYLRSF